MGRVCNDVKRFEAGIDTRGTLQGLNNKWVIYNLIKFPGIVVSGHGQRRVVDL